MKRNWLNRFAILILATTIAGCGGGGDSASPGSGPGAGESGNGGGNTGGGNTGGSADQLRGVASKGGPMAGVEIVAVEANSTRGARATTSADGSFSLNAAGLNRPLRLFATNSRANESFALTAVAFNDQNIVHINEASHAITQAMGSTPSLARQSQLSQALESALGNYKTPGNGSFLNDPAYRADLSGADSVLGQVRVSFVGTGILLENRADPTQRITIDTTVANPPPSTLPAVAASQSINPTDIFTLTRAFEAALAVNSSSAGKFDAVMHPGFQDNDGFTAADVAELSSLVEVGVERFEILRCFADNTATQDRCLVRIVLKANAPDELDFGNPAVANSEVTDNFDVVVERRTAGPNAGPLKLAGGQFSPYSAITHLQHLVQDTIQANGTVASTTPAQTSLVLNVEAASGALGDMYGARANQNVRGALLQRTQTGSTTNLLSLRRPGTGECTEALNLVRNPTNSADCSNELTVANLNNLEVDSRNGRINLGIEINNAAQTQLFQAVRIKRGASVNNAYFPSLNSDGLRALHSYGKSMTPLATLDVQLTLPSGFNQMCISANMAETTPIACVRASRPVSIPNSLLPPRLSSYVLFTVDNEGNKFVRRYNLQ